MASFAYTALDAQGRSTTGALAAESRAAAIEQVCRLGNKVADLFLIQAGQLLGQSLQAGARDEVFGLGDIGRQCRAGAAFSKNVACGVDTQA